MQKIAKWWLGVGLFWLLSGCSASEAPRIESYVEGTLSIREQADSTKDFSMFEIVVATQLEGDVDTLGVALTDRSGHFSMTVAALERGIYPLIISRSGVTMTVAELVVVAGDSTKVSGSFPLDARGLRIVSPENAAWSAYRNTKYQHNRMLLDLLKGEGYEPDEVQRIIMQTSTVLWSLDATYPLTLGADLAVVESVVMLEGWNDSLVVARFGMLADDNASIVEAVRSARRSTARISGLDSSVALIESYIGRVSDTEQRAALQSEIVLAYTDSLDQERALEAALELRRKYPVSDWARWASRAAYELENLMPGMPAPGFLLVTREGHTVTSEDRGLRYQILEFYDPRNTVFQQELADRNELFEALDDRLFHTISISVEPDRDINDALFEESTPPGVFVYADGGLSSDIARAYNIHVVPTRYLIGLDGNIIAKYTGPALRYLGLDLVRIVTEFNQTAASSR